MSALPVEQPPSGDRRARTPMRAARRATPVRQLFPNRKELLPDGDLTFPGGGESFSGDAGRAPGTGLAAASSVAALPPRPGASRPTAAELRLAAAADEAWLASVAKARFAPDTEVPATEVPAPRGPATGVPATGVPATGVRLTRRGRVVLAVLAALVLAGLFVAGATAAQASGPASPHRGDVQVFVQPGDTLWSIARRTDPAADPQGVVQDILRANHLPTVTVTVGQRLWVPRR